MYHWDLPQWLYDLGGWAHRPSAEHFARYASTVARLFGDRIDSISTFNEPWCSSILSYLYGVHAPGKKDLDTTLAVVHGQHRAHGLAVQAIREQRPNLQTGIVLNTHAVRPASNAPDDLAAAKRHEQFHNGLFLGPLFEGDYPAEFLDALGHRLPINWQNDMKTIHQPLDYWGLNYYTPEYIADNSSEGTPFPASKTESRDNVVRTDIGWEIDASAMSDMLSRLYDQYALPPCYITENGAAYNHEISGGTVNDQERIDYIEAHLQAACDSLDQDIPLRGYFAWSLMDNFEWAEGYAMRFGLIHVDYNTQQRTLKKSANWYRHLIQQHHASIQSKAR